MIIGLEGGRDWMQGVARKGIPGRGNSIRKTGQVIVERQGGWNKEESRRNPLSKDSK